MYYVLLYILVILIVICFGFCYMLFGRVGDPGCGEVPGSAVAPASGWSSLFHVPAGFLRIVGVVILVFNGAGNLDWRRWACKWFG